MGGGDDETLRGGDFETLRGGDDETLWRREYFKLRYYGKN
jgi:hypothetical protein